MNMKKVIFVFERYFTIRDYHRFGMEYLENKGYNVEMWKVDIEFHPKVKMKPSIGMYYGSKVQNLSWWEFDKCVQKNRKAIYIFFEYRSIVYMGVMARHGCDYFLIWGTGKILFSGSETIRMNIIKKSSNMMDIVLGKYQIFLRKITEWCFRYHLPQYVFLGVEMNDRWLSYVPDNKKIYVHSFDYDRYLEIKGNESIEDKEEWIVFIDSGFGNLDMNQIVVDFKDPWYGKGEKTWNKLEAVFDKLEEHYHMPVIVAGHPHTKYAEDRLCKRKIIFNNTPELVAKSKFVIMQWSTTVSLALLFRKDILVLIDNDFKKVTNWNNYYKASYKYFGITPCNMDVEKMALSPWEYVHKVDEETARKYINTYVKMPGTPDKLFIEVIEEKIKELSRA